LSPYPSQSITINDALCSPLPTFQWSSADTSLADFCTYFIQHYACKPKEWAACYRKHASINTNMFAEAFHRVFKHIYLKGTVNQRVDVLIHTLIRYSRDKAFDRILKMEKGKSTKRCADIIKRHKLSLDLSFDLISPFGDQWHVKSKTKPLTYTIEKNAETCNCWIKCHSCGICVHNYLCTCPDSLLRGTICKHIHLLARSTSQVRHRDSKPIITSHSTLLESVTSLPRKGSVKNRVLLKLSSISNEVNITNDVNLLLCVEKHLNSCLNGIKLCKSHKKNEPANKRVTPQRNFQSTKRKQSVNKIRLAKPTFEEKLAIMKQLLPSTNVVPRRCIQVST